MIPSYHDLNNENSYHMMMLGMCLCLNKDYEIISNREVGKGRDDLILKAKDEKKIEEAIKTFNKTVENTIASLDKLEVASPSVKNIKDQNKEVLALSSELLVDQLNLATKAPTEEQTKAYQAKVEKLQAAVAKLQKDGADLAQKFAPAAPAAPAAK